MRSSELANAIKIASAAHERQFTRDGMPYILHPLHVMHNVETMAQKGIAILHDVIEDTPLTAALLTVQGIPPPVVEAVEILTKKQGQSYQEYIENIIEEWNRDAVIVKLADLAHNMDLSRLDEVTEKDRLRNEKYNAAHKILSAALADMGEGE